MAKSAYSAQEKHELIMAFENREISIQDFCNQKNIAKTTIKKWIYLFETYGVEGLEASTGWKRYSKEVKTAAVLDYLSGNYSMIKGRSTTLEGTIGNSYALSSKRKKLSPGIGTFQSFLSTGVSVGEEI